MKMSEYKFKVSDGTGIQVYEWLPENPENIQRVVQISHGMAEHSGRYKDFAYFLTQHNTAVYAHDHRGHGKTAGKIENVGYLAKRKGWEKMVQDMKEISTHIKEKYKEQPLYLFGHSMGSFVVRNVLVKPGMKIEGAILSGTGGNPGLLGHIGVILTKILLLFYPGNSPSPFMNKLSFGAFNNSFKPNRTDFDWLSCDNEQVDKYIDDPYCGTIFSIRFFNDLLRGLLHISKQVTINQVPDDISILMFSGEKDPVGNQGKGVIDVYNKFKKAGIKNVTMKLFKDGRHEMLNEVNRMEVFGYVQDWLGKN
jgi:alpha-beta hydrolase superfamily lysophospholipase